MTPLFARVLLKREKPTKLGNIHIPEEYQDRHAGDKCLVVAVGFGCEPEMASLVGRWVLKGRHSGAWLDSDGKVIPDGEYYICEEGDLLAVLDEETVSAPQEEAA